MSRQSTLTAAVATLLGATLGGLFLWRSIYAQKRKAIKVQKDCRSLPVEQHRALELGSTADQHPQQEPSAPSLAATPKCLLLPSIEKTLEVPAVVVSSSEEFEEHWPLFQKDLSVFPVLGLDCEWVKRMRVSIKGKACAVSLLQMATYSGRCMLVRLLPFRDAQLPLPNGLLQVLRDSRVLKVGVGCYEDSKRLASDHGLALVCTVDLRYLALRQRHAVLNNGLSLKSLAADLLNVTLDKSLELRCSNWEAENLSEEQMLYAARDAQVSISLFLYLLGLYSEPCLLSEDETAFSKLAGHCQGLVDVPFRWRSEGDEGERRRRCRRSTVDSPESGDQQVPDPRRIKRKPLGVGYSARKSPLYDNCFLHAPDGQPLCTCDKKKAKWYLDKGIGELVSEDPFIVRLLFEPSGRPDSQKDYYLTAKENLCVVCGKAESYIRKNIVPHEYRRHFPAEMKDHNSHDILLLCTSCHAASNVYDGFLKQQLADEFSAPQGCEEGVRMLEDSDRRRVRSAARALLSANDSMPASRREELLTVVHAYFCKEGEEQAVTEEMLQTAANLETRIFNESYVPHGLKVVQAYAEHGLRGLIDLERRWRQHFLSSMQPNFLPPLWSVDHNHEKYLRKYGENLLIYLT
ncbi:exonuclease 3'-5' domain-containing protein 2 isoform 3-T10 [Clarias gariepinus]|uniref:exonuclease 3'-5' domain-containing protein 2 isoform X1 n=2 Tax=Clarias gariepinus TaxID=13013 RepID=UPI00234D65A1|nr:exonuclease 3'-5' domain-containing protein 2 isoform X1 [Clarias gariepinus]XP_053365990.1 exonuclease 3'-5' domain-containing protein 2 isoform X1 [Clarias gariepinus]XP_053365991.1 exonuclease 3'-5' domain-containing protein 2 isoform X1 [Clarias gariepinus]XP_053365992.1 exonuclease 3'-5' domain-containing protein 2 isoform X1 [Clarias gariepinus]XP_053365993.1 exonuclease 3'-5' domain-containing protein 2 isoform X1 [Clarias gariepinus]XP_053365994.1 exonuclease 3'-5' domain-containing